MKNTVPTWIEQLSQWLLVLPRAQKRGLMLAGDFFFIPAALWCALALRFGDFRYPLSSQLWPYLAVILSAIPVFVRLGLYRAVIRYLGPRALLTVIKGVAFSVIALSALNLFIVSDRLPWSVLTIYAALALLYVSGSRFLIRTLINYRSVGGAHRVAIYGAGSAGVELANGLKRSGRFNPVAFIDDNTALHGSTVAGIEVFSSQLLPELIREESVSTVLLALPSQTRRRRQEILKQLEPLNILVQTVPDYADIVTGNATVEDIRDVDANDLLGRDPVPPDNALMDACIRNKVVMVSGAGGSIGSELCRQIIQLRPARIILFEVSEVALYNIDKELRLLSQYQQTHVEVVALLGNAHHRQRIQEIMTTYGVQTVYHAAAYKHVPIVEQNIVEGIHNNVFSTWYSAEAAIEAKVETFVLISTDKAVNPTNVMGATKRLAEIVLQGLQQRGSGTRFCMVRFGNVLESSGSVVPLFREQINRGGPVTVTHKDIIRYFMTIPEAAQLVIQAGSMAKGGDVFVLDMGKPVRIEDLAKRMIHLMGLTVRDEENPVGDIEIVYTGLRPAEKLYEELLIGNDVMGTDHPRIMRAREHHLPWPNVVDVLESMLDAINRSDCQAARDTLMQAVIEYKPQQDLQDLVWTRNRLAVNAEKGKVTDISSHRARHGN
ncbi:MAG: nucleoside-diphosphate sugar epimerase/dehydratase [Steroidobacter sp.]